MSQVLGQRRARLLLLVLVAAGVALMHTLGHPSGGSHAGGSGMHRPAAVSQPMVDPPAVMLAGAAVAAAVSDDMAMGLDPMNVCLAILLGGFVVLLAAVVLAWRRPVPRRDPASSAAGHRGRAPPVPALGLRLADLSVQRT